VQRKSHELVDAQVDAILTNLTDKARGPASPRAGQSDSPMIPSPTPAAQDERDRHGNTASRRQQKLNVLDDLLDKMDTLGPLQVPNTSMPERKAEKLVVSVRWPDEISGAEAYSRVRFDLSAIRALAPSPSRLFIIYSTLLHARWSLTAGSLLPPT
jgi:hypothetical protein